MHQPFDDTDLNAYVLLVSRKPLPIAVSGRPSRSARGGYVVEVQIDGHPVIELDVSSAAWRRIARDPALRGRQTVVFVAQQYEDGAVFGELGVFPPEEDREPWKDAACAYESSLHEDAFELVVLADARRGFRQRRHPKDLTREALSMLAELCLAGARTPDAATVDSFLASLGVQ